MDYIKGLDGFRGILVLVIAVFHTFTVFYPQYLYYFPGGFLAVESFFVLSGFLITRTLIKTFEKEENRFTAFLIYLKRRFLRIFPALFFMITTLYGVQKLFSLSISKYFEEESLFGLSFSYNFYLIFKEIPYFEKFEDVKLLLHLWSLSIEAQLYLLLGFIFLISSFLGSFSKAFKFTVFSILTIGSIAINFFYFNILDVDINKIYFTTESRSFGFFIGGILALYEEKVRGIFGEFFGYLTGFLGFSGLIATFFLFSYYTDWFCPFGFLVADLLTVSVIIGFLNSEYIKMSMGLFDIFGERSYSFYLWHYPIFSVVNTLYGSDILFITMAYLLTISISDLSYQLIEKPFRRLEFTIKPIPLFLSSTAFIVISTSFFSLSNIQKIISPQMDISDTVQEKKAEDNQIDEAVSVVNLDEDIKETPEYIKEIKYDRTVDVGGKRVIIIGDSVLLGASNYIKKIIPTAKIDAKVGRQGLEIPSLIESYREDINKSDVIVFHIGTNGYIKQSLLEEIVNKIEKDKKIYFITVNALVPWKEKVNQNIRNLLSKYENVSVIEWDKLIDDQLFAKDKVHLSGKGIVKYSKLIATTLGVDGDVVYSKLDKISAKSSDLSKFNENKDSESKITKNEENSNNINSQRDESQIIAEDVLKVINETH
ncbi:MAG: acyltransferase family protein [Hydrogenothermaceae bacterium]